MGSSQDSSLTKGPSAPISSRSCPTTPPVAPVTSKGRGRRPPLKVLRDPGQPLRRSEASQLPRHGRIAQRRPTVDDAPTVAVVLVGLPRDRPLLVHAGPREVAYAAGDARLPRPPLGICQRNHPGVRVAA